jgi:hypothetical protein
MTLLGFKTILHKKCRSGKNSEGPAENSWVMDLEKFNIYSGFFCEIFLLPDLYQLCKL